MEVVDLAIPGVKLLRPQRRADDRGWFVEQFNARAAKEAGLPFQPVQDNISLSRAVGTVRGLHFQAEPSAQAKLVSVLSGAILDVVVDIRHGSPTFGEHVTAELDAEEGWQLFAPRGLAHGFCTLKRDTLVHYKVDGFYDGKRDFGLLWNDPDLGIDWPVEASQVKLSDKDAGQPRLRDLPSYFQYSATS